MHLVPVRSAYIEYEQSLQPWQGINVRNWELQTKTYYCTKLWC